MEDIKVYLEQSNAKCWEKLKENKPTFLDRIEGSEITTEKMDKILAEQIKEFLEYKGDFYYERY